MVALHKTFSAEFQPLTFPMDGLVFFQLNQKQQFTSTSEQVPRCIMMAQQTPLGDIEQSSKPHRVSITSQFCATPCGVLHCPMSPQGCLFASTMCRMRETRATGREALSGQTHSGCRGSLWSLRNYPLLNLESHPFGTICFDSRA